MVLAEDLLALPFEIIFTILLRLPAEVLVRFMLVCRQWRDLIKDADFILEHLQFWASEGDDYILFAPDKYRNQWFNLLVDKNPAEVLEDWRMEFHCFLNKRPLLHDSSKGLVLLTCTNSGSPLFLYNPFIRKFKTITGTSISIGNHGKEVFGFGFGFGYHSQTNDYKIVRIVYFSTGDDSTEAELEVYSLSTDSWRRLDGRSFSWYIHRGYSRSVQVNDHLHWLAHPNYNYFGGCIILTFDLQTEVFQTICLPNYVVPTTFSKDLIAYKDKLALINIWPNYSPRNECTLWVMMEYGVFDSWCCLFNIFLDSFDAMPITFTKHDELIFVDEDIVVGYNIFTHERQSFPFPAKNWSKFFPLTNSLALLETPWEE